MKDELIKVYEAEIEALRTELEMTRKYIYREYELYRNISNEACQDLIDVFIKFNKK